MHKKLMMACMAIAAFAAFVIAPAASATALREGGALVPVGAAIKGTNTGVTKFTASGFNVECSNDVLTGSVTKNPGGATGVVEGKISAANAKFNGTGTSGDCTSALGSTKVTVTSELCLKTASSDTGSVTGCGGNVKFDLEITGTGNCEYSTASIAATHNTSESFATVNISEGAASKVAGGIFCPSSGKLDMDFDLTTENGTALSFTTE